MPSTVRTPSPEASQPSAAPPASPGDAPAPDGLPLRPGGDTFIDGEHVEPAGRLRYKLYLPPGPAGPPRPLVVMLHGCLQDPDDFATGTAMNELAREHGFFVLYPAQSEHTNAQRCWSWFRRSHQQRGRGEPALLAGMTQAVMRLHGIDAQRVYAAGLSSGGAMAAILGQAYPELFAAVGVHSGLAPGGVRDLNSALAAMREGHASAPQATPRPPHGAQRPVRAGEPLPTIVFHGDHDMTVHPRNGTQLGVAAGGPHARVQVEHGRAPHGHRYTRTLYRSAAGHLLAEHWELHGAGHAWSGGNPPGSFTDARGPDASREMWRFFSEHPLRRPR